MSTALRRRGISCKDGGHADLGNESRDPPRLPSCRTHRSHQSFHLDSAQIPSRLTSHQDFATFILTITTSNYHTTHKCLDSRTPLNATSPKTKPIYLADGQNLGQSTNNCERSFHSTLLLKRCSRLGQKPARWAEAGPAQDSETHTFDPVPTDLCTFTPNSILTRHMLPSNNTCTPYCLLLRTPCSATSPPCPDQS